jgi:hypothetical protein
MSRCDGVTVVRSHGGVLQADVLMVSGPAIV